VAVKMVAKEKTRKDAHSVEDAQTKSRQYSVKWHQDLMYNSKRKYHRNIVAKKKKPR
jgi:hypothetical protein